MRRILVVLGALFAALAFLPASPAGAEDYPSDLATSCHIETPGAIDGERVVVDIAVTSNSSQQPTGTAEVSISKGGGSGRAAPGAVWSTSVPYDGSPVRITGPRLKPGRYIANMAFHPSSGAYQSCTGTLAFRVSPGAVSPAGEGPGGSGAATGAAGGGGVGVGGGLLPNTGGPHLALLLLGLGLLVAGGGVVTRSRRLA